MTKIVDWRIKDKYISLQNKSHLSDNDILTARNYIQKKYKLNVVDSLQYLINSYIDGKMILEKNKIERMSYSGKDNNILKNLENL
jgi:hypothetical protein